MRYLLATLPISLKYWHSAKPVFFSAKIHSWWERRYLLGNWFWPWRLLYSFARLMQWSSQTSKSEAITLSRLSDIIVLHLPIIWTSPPPPTPTPLFLPPTLCPPAHPRKQFDEDQHSLLSSEWMMFFSCISVQFHLYDYFLMSLFTLKLITK